MMLGAAGMLAAGPFSGAKKNSPVQETPKMQVPERNRRPYSRLDWSKVCRVKTTTHGHCMDQAMLDEYLKRGFELLTISNYYPSAPYYPIAEMTRNYYRVHHDHPVMVNGKRTSGPFDWNRIVSEWKGELGEEQVKELPFKEGEKLFKPLPEGVLEAPNAEHHGFRLADGRLVENLDMCAPGSGFMSGTFDAANKFKSHGRGYDSGSGEFWGTAINRMIDGMVYPDGGGVTVNHPKWTKLDRGLLLELLDYDSRVLGIEVLSAGCNSENYWDWALSTGRQCFGFFVPDWSIKAKRFGVNVLCVHEKTVHACLKAYREGNFYGAAVGLDDLAFTSLSFDGKRVVATTDKPARLKIITARGVVKVMEGTEIAWDVVPDGASVGPRIDVFARVKAYAIDDSGEELFSQPFMLV
jgi:hypothetical protein